MDTLYNLTYYQVLFLEAILSWLEHSPSSGCHSDQDSMLKIRLSKSNKIDTSKIVNDTNAFGQIVSNCCYKRLL